MDEVVRLLHSKHGMKCVIFIFDEHILKAGEIRGPLTFDDYNFLGETNKPFVVQVHGRADEAMIKTNKNESSIGFIIRRRGLYVCGDDPTELLKRYNFLVKKQFVKILIEIIFILQHTCSSFGYQSKTIGTCGYPHTETLKTHKHINNKTK